MVYTSIDPPPKVYLDCSVGGPSMTVQSFQAETDINVIMARYEKTGLVPDALAPDRRELVFGDFSGPLDFQSCQERVVAAELEFGRLPARVRERFGNRVGPLLAFLEDPQNLKEAQDLGLVPVVAPGPVGEVPAAVPVVAPVVPLGR